MAITDWEEIGPSPKKMYNREGGSATRIFKIPGTDEELFLSRSLYPNEFSGYPAEAFVPGASWKIVQSVTFEPFGGEDLAPEAGDFNTYDYLRVTVEYGPRPDDHEENRPGGGDQNSPGGSDGATGGETGGDGSDELDRINWSGNIGGEFMTLPNQGLEWEDGEAVTEDIQAGVVIPTIEHSVNWHCRHPPWAAIRALVGRCNDGVFMGAQDQMLLFLGAEWQQERTVQGHSAYDLTYKFSEKVLRHWNTFFRPTDGQWKILKQKNGDRIYERDDFTDLWVPQL